jgi:hypothetical protein
VLDDFGSASDPKSLEVFLEEAVARVSELSVVTIGGALPGAVVVGVPPLTCAETALLLRGTGLAPASHVLDSLLQSSAGNARMGAAVASWWSGDDRGLRELERHLEGRGALANLADLTAFARLPAA